MFILDNFIIFSWNLIIILLFKRNFDQMYSVRGSLFQNIFFFSYLFPGFFENYYSLIKKINQKLNDNKANRYTTK